VGFRIGSAFILIGVIALTVYLLGFSIGQSESGLLLTGLVLSLAGLIIHRSSAARSKRRSTRFQSVRRLMGGEQEEERP